MIKKIVCLLLLVSSFINCTTQDFKIPRIMHSLWLGKEFPAHYHMFRLNWVRKHPDWIHILWVDDARNYIYSQKKGFTEFNEVLASDCRGKLIVLDIKALGFDETNIYKESDYNLKSDIARYQIVKKFGGAYVNVDCDCFKSLDALHAMVDCYVGQSIVEEKQILSTMIFGAIPDHAVINTCLQNCFKNNAEFELQSLLAHDLTLRTMIQKGNVGVFPLSYFFPKERNSFIGSERIIDHNSHDNKHVIGLHNGGEGLFSVLKGVIHHLAYCMRYNKTPVVVWDEISSYYQPEGYHGATNVWEYYFEPVSSAIYEKSDYIWNLYGAPDNSGISVEHLESHEKSFRRFVKQIMDKFITIRPYIQEKIANFYQNYMFGKRTIGIHIRNTDRSHERDKISLERIFNEANKYADGNTQFLVATDEKVLLEQARKVLKGNVIAYESFRSLDGQPIHISKEHGYDRAKLGEEALIEVMLLSECDVLIHTISNFSYFALLFNPELDTVLLQ